MLKTAIKSARKFTWTTLSFCRSCTLRNMPLLVRTLLSTPCTEAFAFKYLCYESLAYEHMTYENSCSRFQSIVTAYLRKGSETAAQMCDRMSLARKRGGCQDLRARIEIFI
jgi:hypothetical protein